MKIVTWEELASKGQTLGPLGITIGVFDGIHLGHKMLLERLIKACQHMDSESNACERLYPAVVTFAKNPKSIMSPESYSGDILTFRQKLALLESLGIEFVILIDFCREFGKIPGRQFLEYINTHTGIKLIVLGKGFRCGRDLDIGIAELASFFESYPVEIQVLASHTKSGERISSTRIRSAILRGDLDLASSMLGHAVRIDSTSIHAGNQTQDASPLMQIMPPLGDYRVSFSGNGLMHDGLAHYDGKGRWKLDPNPVRFDEMAIVEQLSGDSISRIGL